MNKQEQQITEEQRQKRAIDFVGIVMGFEVIKRVNEGLAMTLHRDLARFDGNDNEINALKTLVQTSLEKSNDLVQKYKANVDVITGASKQPKEKSIVDDIKEKEAMKQKAPTPQPEGGVTPKTPKKPDKKEVKKK